MRRFTERDEFGNANIIGVDSEEMQINLAFDELNRVTNALNKLAKYEDLEEQNKLLKLPFAVGDTVYVITKCGNIPQRLDGTLYDEDGGMGTATGYYCPYTDECPFESEDFEYCEKYRQNETVFEDSIIQIVINHDGVLLGTENCLILSQLGENIFLTRKEAESALTSMG